MRILITGAKGQLGSELIEIIKNGKADIGSISKNITESEIVAYDVDELDIINLNQVKKAIDEIKPDVVINCAAATNVDGCENNKDLAFKINALGARNLAIACEDVSTKLLHVSTDYIFSGIGEEPLREYDTPNPQTIYGKSKLAGENYVKEFCSKYFIVRTAWLYGYYGNNFVYTISKIAKDKGYIKVVNDQIGNPTYANDLAYHILKLIETEEYGIYHCTGDGQCSWYEFAKEIIGMQNIQCDVAPCTTEEFPRPAKRPEYSSLDNMMLRCTVGDEMRDWKEALKAFIDKIT